MELLSCPKCGAELSGDRVNTQTGLATCGSCSAVFTLGTAEAPAYDSSYKDVPQPAGVTVTENDHGLMVASKASKGKAISIAVFAVLWNGIIFGLMMPAVLGSGSGGMGLFLLPFVAIGIGIGYYAAVLLVNKNYVSASGSTLRITSAPLPWPGNTQLDRKDIRQLYVKEQFHRTSSSNGHSRTYYTYDLSVVTEGGTRKKLISLEKPETALFFERTIEKHLGIEDSQVSGELQG